MARFVVIWQNVNGLYEVLNAGDADQAFDAGSGGGAITAAAVQSNRNGKYVALPVDGMSYATLTTTLGVTNAEITYTSRRAGSDGNSITLRYVVSGNNTALSVAVTGTDITVNVATNGAGAATSTALQVRDAVNNHAQASLLVSATLASANDGTGVVSAMPPTPLGGGLNTAAVAQNVTMTLSPAQSDTTF
jgi:hypothetical protein